MSKLKAGLKILEQAGPVGAMASLSEVHRGVLERVIELGGDDNSAVIRAYRSD